MVSSIVHYSVVILLNRNYYSKWKVWLGLMAYFQVFPRLCFKTRLSAKLLITTTTIINNDKPFLYLIYIFFLSLDKLQMALGKNLKKKQTKINQKTMIHRREFENKLTKELL